MYRIQAERYERTSGRVLAAPLRSVHGSDQQTESHTRREESGDSEEGSGDIPAQNATTEILQLIIVIDIYISSNNVGWCSNDDGNDDCTQIL